MWWYIPVVAPYPNTILPCGKDKDKMTKTIYSLIPVNYFPQSYRLHPVRPLPLYYNHIKYNNNRYLYIPTISLDKTQLVGGSWWWDPIQGSHESISTHSLGFVFILWCFIEYISIKIDYFHLKYLHSNHLTSSKRADTLICHTTMRRGPRHFLYNPGHMPLWWLQVVPVLYSSHAIPHDRTHNEWSQNMVMVDHFLSEWSHILVMVDHFLSEWSHILVMVDHFLSEWSHILVMVDHFLSEWSHILVMVDHFLSKCSHHYTTTIVHKKNLI